MSTRIQRYRYTRMAETSASLDALDKAMTIEGAPPVRRFHMDLQQAQKSSETIEQESAAAIALAASCGMTLPRKPQ